MVDQLDMFGAPMPKIVPPASKGEAKPVETPLFPQVAQVEKKEGKKEKKAPLQKQPEEQVTDLTTKAQPKEEALAIESDTSKPRPSEIFAAEVFEQWKQVIDPLKKTGADEDYYHSLYLQWAAPTQEEESQPYHKKTDAYWQKLASVYVWPTLWRLFSEKII